MAIKNNALLILLIFFLIFLKKNILVNKIVYYGKFSHLCHILLLLNLLKFNQKKFILK